MYPAIILSCKLADKKELRDSQKLIFLERLRKEHSINYYHVIGDKNQKEEYKIDFQDRLITVSCEDSYAALTKKTVLAYKAIYELFGGRFTHLFKFDDDTYIDADKFNVEDFKEDYCGNMFHRDAATYAASGAFYVLSKHSVEIILRNLHKLTNMHGSCEDVEISRVLQENGIVPVKKNDLINPWGSTTHNKKCVVYHWIKNHEQHTKLYSRLAEDVYDFTIISIATNGYYESAIHLFSQIKEKDKNHKIQFIVLSNRNECLDPDIEHIHIDAEKWPYVTLHKAKHLARFAHRLRGKWTVMLDADTSVNNRFVDLSLFKKDIFGVYHWMNDFWPKDGLPPGYETNKNSTAYVAVEDYFKKPYIQGAVLGGLTNNLVKAARIMDKNIDIDKNNGIIAYRHDESHWNRYIVSQPLGEVLNMNLYDSHFLTSDKSKIT